MLKAASSGFISLRADPNPVTQSSTYATQNEQFILYQLHYFFFTIMIFNLSF